MPPTHPVKSPSLRALSVVVFVLGHYFVFFTVIWLIDKHSRNPSIHPIHDMASFRVSGCRPSRLASPQDRLIKRAGEHIEDPHMEEFTC